MRLDTCCIACAELSLDLGGRSQIVLALLLVPVRRLCMLRIHLGKKETVGFNCNSDFGAAHCAGESL